MDVPVGFLSKLWSFVSFLPFFLLLLLLGTIKAVLICPVAAIIVFFGNSAVIIGLWPAHFVWTYYCVLKTKRIGPVLKLLITVSLPLPLLVLPIFAIVGSLLVGIGYGFFAPLLATFEAVGEGVVDKLTHCFMDGCASTIKGACAVVVDVTDVCFHSYFSLTDELGEKMAEDEVPVDIKLSYLPRSLLVSLIAIPVDVLMISCVALWKSPYMLLRGWQRFCEDLIGREGPFLETVCVPFAGLIIVLWPFAVIGAVIAAFISSLFLGLIAGLIAYQEDSLRMGLAYMVAVIAMFDEYTNDLLYLREGSCFPRFVRLDSKLLPTARPKYRKANILENGSRTGWNKVEEGGTAAESVESQQNDHNKPSRANLALQRTRTLVKTIQQLRPIQIWDWLFRSCELNGRILLSEGLISAEDMEECITKGKCRKLSIKLPAWCILQCLMRSAKSNSPGLLISDNVEVTNFNWPKDKVLDWMLGPLLVMKEQIKRLELSEDEEMSLRKLIMTNKNEDPADWDDCDFLCGDNIKRAQLQAIIRRLQGIVMNISRMPSFRRRLINLVKALYLEATEAGVITPGNSNAQVKINVTSRDMEDTGAVGKGGASDSTTTGRNMEIV